MDKVGLSGEYQTYPEYKDSGVEWLGEVPLEWSSVPIKYMALSKGSLFLDGDWIESKDISGDEIRYITTGNVGEGIYKEQGLGFISEEKFKQLDCTEVYESDILISRLNNPIGRACIVPDLESRIVTSVDNVIFRPDTKYDKKFIVYLFSSADYFKHTSNLARGATMQRISRGLLGNIRIVIPSVIEQQQIASFLDHETAKIDTLIEKQQQLIKLLKEKRQAVISHAVTKGLNPNAPMRDSGVEWLGEVPEHWDFVPIKHIVEIPVTDGPHETPNFIDEGVPFISAEAVSAGKIDFKKIRAHISEEDNERYSLKYSPKIHDIYMVKSGATTGVTAIVETHVNFNIWSPLAVIRCKEDSSPYFVLNFMRSINFQEAVELNWSFGTQQNIGMGVIENLIVTKPPLVEAIEIVENLKIKCSLYDSVIGKALNQIDLMKERRTALISAAVTGKIDVRDWVAPESSNNTMESRLRGNDAELNAAVDLNTEADLSKEAGL
jgi:type I restriction enzyme S subunit